MREVDRLTVEQFAMPSLLLMETAARSAALEIAARCPGGIEGRHALVLCGRGNNGGDGAALARALCLAGARVDVVLFGRAEESRGDARVNFDNVRLLAHGRANDDGATESVFRRAGTLEFTECTSLEEWRSFLDRMRRPPAIVVDALFGTGLTRPLEGIHEAAVDSVNAMRQGNGSTGSIPPFVVSLDIPSGLNADASSPIGKAVKADLTVTFSSPKSANVLPPASDLNGELVVVEIGSPQSLIDATPSILFLAEAEDARRWLETTRYLPGTYKNVHGHAWIIAGSRGMTGAPALCGNAAMRSGAGLVTVATPHSIHETVASKLLPEVMTSPLPETERGITSHGALEIILEVAKKASVIAIGPGLGIDGDETRRLVRGLIDRCVAPLVLDADALNALAPWPDGLRGSRDRPLILTPHPGEMQRLLGAGDREALRDRVAVAREFSTSHEVILVLKGARTIVAAPDGRVTVNPTGNPGLGTAGSGDTLTGIITGFNAQAVGTLKDSADAVAATVAAVYTGGLAGDIAARSIGMRAMTASDIRESLGAAIRSLDESGEMP